MPWVSSYHSFTNAVRLCAAPSVAAAPRPGMLPMPAAARPAATGPMQAGPQGATRPAGVPLPVSAVPPGMRPMPRPQQPRPAVPGAPQQAGPATSAPALVGAHAAPVPGAAPQAAQAVPGAAVQQPPGAAQQPAAPVATPLPQVHDILTAEMKWTCIRTPLPMPLRHTPYCFHVLRKLLDVRRPPLQLSWFPYYAAACATGKAGADSRREGSGSSSGRTC